ncbi:UNVERIFIED_CONTAM: hypothetical protein Slati_1163100 [Sesamum latifolium]|uniref:Uncharacterized protein n=1 Tax=Sesamum latifolium TaxID=2727402 RepID=A0AAW2XDX7_9LAMI
MALYRIIRCSRGFKGWYILKTMSRQSDAPWMCAGDFNEILYQHEKMRPPRLLWQITDFRQALEYCSLSDLGYSGSKFTWCRQAPEMVRARLDRACANPTWVAKFSGYKVTHIPSCQSDHQMLMVDVNIPENRCHGTCSHHFRFDSRWIRSKDCRRAIEESWTQGVAGGAHEVLWKIIQRCRVDLLKWNRTEFEQPKREIKMLEERFVQLEASQLTMEVSRELQEFRT